jgi:serine/threonine protein kinase
LSGEDVRERTFREVLGNATTIRNTDHSPCRQAQRIHRRAGHDLAGPRALDFSDEGDPDINPFTVFEYIEGDTPLELIERRGRLPLDEVRLIIGPLAQALDFAHARRIVHRDLKLENIRATEQRLFKVLDLGLAREFSRQEDWRFAGTPAYAAPEQAAERPSDGRTDQYALAVNQPDDDDLKRFCDEAAAVLYLASPALVPKSPPGRG